MADAQQPCPEANPTYLSNCGPTFVLPAWGDAGGWTDPSQYATIQLADVNGDGRDELIGRGDNGVQIHRFDTTFGQWRPQVDAKGTQLVLTDFRSPLPSEEGGPNWNQPQYALTIQSANLDGRPGEEVYGRFPDGVRAYTYVPPQGTTDVDGGSWQRIPGTAGFSDAVGGADPSIYTTIHSGVLHDGSTYIFGRRHPTADHPGPLGFAVLRAGEWVLGSADNPTPLAPPDQWSDAECGQPACYLNVRGAEIMTSAPDPSTGYDQTLQGIGQVLSRTSAGVGALTFDSYNRWFPVGGAPDHPFTAIGPGDSLQYPGPFGDAPGAPDCPFSSNGASGPGSGDCLGASPSYYETLRTANIDGKPGQEVLARASDGLRVKRWYGATRYGYESLATLTDLAGAGLVETVAPGVWGSIRTGDIDGNGRDEVLALDGSGLQIWSYDPAGNAWTKRTQSTPLALAANPWLTHPEYYSTIETGDVDGDGHDDVVARGQFGIRTWFFDRRGTGAWEPYLAEGYPDFPSRQCPSGVTAPCGQQGAYNALNPLVASSGTVRDVWTVQDVPVDMASTLSDLQADLAKPLVGNCVNQTRLKPPTYASCTPPANSSAFTADEWTTVVNELLSEAYYAEQVVGHFDDITSLRQQLFISEQAVLPAIKDDLDLAGAAGNTADFDLQGFFAGTTGIAASIAGAAAAEAPELSAGLWVVSELISMLPSASRTANSSFPTTYGGLVNKFATVVQETDNALTSQSQQVRNDLPLMTLVSDLRTSGTWKLDQTGMKSAANQAFALWVYQALLPTMYSRYSVTNCVQSPPPPNTFNCQDLPSGPYVVGGSDTSATWLGPTNDSPCSGYYGTVYCDYLQDPGTIPDDLASTLFGPLSSTCSYVPNNSNTAWTFDDCTVGVPVATSVGANGKGWSFATYSGSPVVAGGASAVRAAPRVARATAAAASASSSRDVLSPLRFRGRHVIARGLRLRRMRVRVDRVLFEHGRREELAVTRSGGRLRPVTLRHVRGGLFASTRRTGPRVRLRLRRLDARGRARVDLQLSRVRTRDIRALCGVLPAAVSRAGRPLELETRLRLRDGASVGRIAVRQDWRCVRDRKGEFSGIRPVASKRAAARPGLAVRLDAPQVSASGRRATVRVTVANRRRPGAGRVVSSLHNLRIAGSAGGAPRTVGVEELRAGRSRTMRLSFRVPRRAGGRACVRVEVHADSARGAAARRCARIAGAPRFTG